MSHELGLQTAPNTQFQAGYFLVIALYNVNKCGCPGHMNNTEAPPPSKSFACEGLPISRKLT